jgi:DNA-binding beta-propeller fold protein YncE
MYMNFLCHQNFPTDRNNTTDENFYPLRCFYPLGMLLLFLVISCGEKFPLPPQNVTTNRGIVTDTLYVQQTPVWGAAQNYTFRGPADVYVGPEPLVYVADTGNDRIVMLDPVGNVLGSSGRIPHPVAITQDNQLDLLVVNNTNRVYRINLVEANHVIANARIDTILTLEQRDRPRWRFTAIAAYLGRSYYVTRTGPETADNAIVQFNERDELVGPLPLVPGGTGFFSVTEPSGIISVRRGSVDFIFTQIGNSFHRAQWITTDAYGFTAKIEQGKAFYTPGKFSSPEDIALDDAGNIYVIDAGSDSLYKFNPGGGEFRSQSFGGRGAGERQFNQPSGAAWFNKVLYIADTGNNRIVRFKLNTDL